MSATPSGDGPPYNPLLGHFVFSAVSASKQWEIWTSYMRWQQRTHRMGIFINDMTIKGSISGTGCVTTDRKYLISHLLVLQQFKNYFCFPWSCQPDCTKKYVITVISIRRCPTHSNPLNRNCSVQVFLYLFDKLSIEVKTQSLSLQSVCSVSSDLLNFQYSSTSTCELMFWELQHFPGRLLLCWRSLEVI